MTYHLLARSMMTAMFITVLSVVCAPAQTVAGFSQERTVAGTRDGKGKNEQPSENPLIIRIAGPGANAASPADMRPDSDAQYQAVNMCTSDAFDDQRDWVKPSEQSLCCWKEDALERKPLSSPQEFLRGVGSSGSSQAEKQQSGIRWGSLALQSLKFTTIMNLFRVATEPSTRKDLKGPFWSDYFNSVKRLRGWRDGDEFLVNYIGHPMEGAVSGYMLIQNDRAGARLQFGRTKEYWMSRFKALGWATVLSTQFEIGPYGEATIGNVGLTPSEKSRHPAAYVDLVVTPIIGTSWLIGEDMLDRFVIRKIEERTTNRFVRLMFRSWLNPSRSFANLMRGQWFWHRDDRSLSDK